MNSTMELEDGKSQSINFLNLTVIRDRNFLITFQTGTGRVLHLADWLIITARIKELSFLERQKDLSTRF